MPTVEELWAGLEALGEDQVRRQLILGVYGDHGDRRAAVEEWLRKREVSRVEARDQRILRWTIAGAIAAFVAAVTGAASVAISFR